VSGGALNSTHSLNGANYIGFQGDEAAASWLEAVDHSWAPSFTPAPKLSTGVPVPMVWLGRSVSNVVYIGG